MTIEAIINVLREHERPTVSKIVSGWVCHPCGERLNSRGPITASDAHRRHVAERISSEMESWRAYTR